MAHRQLTRALAVGLLLAAAACNSLPGSSRSTTTTRPIVVPPGPGDDEAALAPAGGPDRPRGGTARVGVWGAPDPAAPGLGGAAVRALVLPQLFVARPDGRWETSLAVPGSDHTAGDRRSAEVVLRPGAAWSDGRPLGADDLRRTADSRFVAGIDGPAADGRMTIRFTQALPGWRRLWSGDDTIAPPAPGVWGGPFVVASVTPGLETVLRPNPRWGGRGPWLDEVRLLLVPDQTTGRQLLEAGQLDVLMPLASTHRREQVAAGPGVHVAAAARGGFRLGLLMNTAKIDADHRRRLVASLDRDRFLRVLLAGEAFALDGFLGPEDGAWAGLAGTGEVKGLGKVELTGQVEEPNTYLLQRAMQKRARAAGSEIELRNAEADRVESWVASGAYEAALVVQHDGPVMCWSCRWGPVDGRLASAADAGDGPAAAALERRLRDESHLLPLWRGRTLVAWRDGLEGVRANGFGLSGAWNAWEWWRAP